MESEVIGWTVGGHLPAAEEDQGFCGINGYLVIKCDATGEDLLLH
jgi:hypothetical protein